MLVQPSLFMMKQLAQIWWKLNLHCCTSNDAIVAGKNWTSGVLSGVTCAHMPAWKAATPPISSSRVSCAVGQRHLASWNIPGMGEESTNNRVDIWRRGDRQQSTADCITQQKTNTQSRRYPFLPYDNDATAAVTDWYIYIYICESLHPVVTPALV